MTVTIPVWNLAVSNDDYLLHLPPHLINELPGAWPVCLLSIEKTPPLALTRRLKGCAHLPHTVPSFRATAAYAVLQFESPIPPDEVMMHG